MACVYVQRTGHVYDVAGHEAGTGYAGHGEGLNNPAWQDHVGVGPLPCGKYTIGPPHAPLDHLGPLALSLLPAQDNAMFGRSGFFIHGDNAATNHTASNGCIILARPLREAIHASAVQTLIVVAEDADVAGVYATMVA